MPKETKSTYCEHCGEFHDEPHEYVSSVKVGEHIPDFEFEAYQAGKVKKMSLSSLRGKWLVIAFYPADFSGLCGDEHADLAELYPRFKEAGAELVTVSSDTVFAHKAWAESNDKIGKGGYAMAADPSGKIGYAFGVFTEGGEPEFTPEEGLSTRATFIVDPSGVLRSMEVYESSYRRDFAETLKKLETLQK
jgi:peroxiredoxin (alkyl hydroperoxide reductase subunit C)